MLNYKIILQNKDGHIVNNPLIVPNFVEHIKAVLGEWFKANPENNKSI